MKSRIQALVLVGASLALAGGLEARGAANELEQMTGLVRFLGDRIATEDPTLPPDVRHAALLDALEMMGVELPEDIRRRPGLTPEQVALAVLTAPPPSRAAGRGAPTSGGTLPDPFVDEPVAGDPLRELPSTPPEGWQADPDRLLSIRRILASFPLPAAYRSHQERDMEPIALMARTMIENPDTSSPWAPTLKPTGAEAGVVEVRRDLRQRLQETPATPPEGSLQERLAAIRRRAGLDEPGPQVTTPPSLSAPQHETQDEFRDRLETMLRRRGLLDAAPGGARTEPGPPSPLPAHGQATPGGEPGA